MVLKDTFIRRQLDDAEKHLSLLNDFKGENGIINHQIPGYFHVNRMEDIALIFLDKNGCDRFHIHPDQLEKGTENFFQQRIHPEDFDRCLYQLKTFAAKKDEKAIFFYFKRLRLTPDTEEYHLALTSVRLDLKNNVFICITNVTDQHPIFTRKVLHALNENIDLRQKVKRFKLLSKREQQVLRCICNGMNTKTVAEHLFISTRTVEQHRKNIYRKLQVSKLPELLHFSSLLTP